MVKKVEFLSIFFIFYRSLGEFFLFCFRSVRFKTDKKKSQFSLYLPPYFSLLCLSLSSNPSLRLDTLSSIFPPSLHTSKHTLTHSQHTQKHTYIKTFQVTHPIFISTSLHIFPSCVSPFPPILLSG